VCVCFEGNIFFAFLGTVGCWTFVVPNVFLSSSHDVLEGGDYNIFILRLSKF
jgi:hypothetical protein